MSSSLVWEDPLEEGMATHFSIVAWRIPRAREPGGSHIKESVCNVGDLSLIFAEGNDNPVQYSCLENSMDRRA